MKDLWKWLGSIITVLLLTACQSKPDVKITVAVAANMHYTIKELITAFNKQHLGKIEVVSGSSGKLTQQILHGAPYDIFISADTLYPQILVEKGFAEIPAKIYANGVLVFWSTKTNFELDKIGSILFDAHVKHIAIANPQTAPYGKAAIEWMKLNGLYEQNEKKIVVGENISQASQFIMTGNADVGFTAKSIVLSTTLKNTGKWIELDGYPSIKQSAVLLKQADASNALAKDFYEFLYSDTAKKILKQSGYLVQ